MPDSFPLWPTLTGLLGSLAGVAALIGVWLNRRRVPAEVRLITAQEAVAVATVERTERESESLAVNTLSKALSDADRTIDRLRGERDAADVRVGQLLIERQELKDELKHVTGLLQAAEEELGLKVRRDDGR